MALDAFRIPPEYAPAFTATPASVAAQGDAVVERLRKLENEILDKYPLSDWTFENAMLPLIHQRHQNMWAMWGLEFNNHFTINKDLKDVATKKYDAWFHNLKSKEFVAKFCPAVSNIIESDRGLDPDSQVWLRNNYLLCVGDGAFLDGDEKKRYLDLKDEGRKLGREFNAERKPQKEVVWFTREELEGVPDETVNRFRQGSGENEEKLAMTFSEVDWLKVVEYAERSETRRRVRIAQSNLYPSNVDRYRQLMETRAERAPMLRYNNWVDYSIDGDMMQTSKRVGDFLRELKEDLLPVARRTIQRVKDLKRALTERLGQTAQMLPGGDTTDDHFFFWDWDFFKRLLVEREYSFNTLELKGWFAADATEDAMLTMLGRLFGLKFEEVTGKNLDKVSESGKGSEALWYNDGTLRLFAAWNDDEGNTDFLGYLYIDLYYHEGKTDKTRSKKVYPGFQRPDGTWSRPSLVLNMGLATPTPNKPTLLTMTNLVDLIHELGHSIHSLVRQNKYGELSGTRVAIDFIETPSIMLENFVYNLDILRGLSQHWSYIKPEYRQTYLEESKGAEQPPERLPENMARRVVKSRFGWLALSVLVPTFYALFDHKAHTQSLSELKRFDFTSYWNSLRASTYLAEGMEVYGQGWNWGHGYTQWRNAATGYSSLYYTYALNPVWSMDIYKTAFADDPLNVAMVRRWRHMVLERAGVVPELETLKDFLGREPNSKALKEVIEEAEAQHLAEQAALPPEEDELHVGDARSDYNLRNTPERRKRIRPGEADVEEEGTQPDVGSGFGGHDLRMTPRRRQKLEVGSAGGGGGGQGGSKGRATV